MQSDQPAAGYRNQEAELVHLALSEHDRACIVSVRELIADRAEHFATVFAASRDDRVKTATEMVRRMVCAPHAERHGGEPGSAAYTRQLLRAHARFDRAAAPTERELTRALERVERGDATRFSDALGVEMSARVPDRSLRR